MSEGFMCPTCNRRLYITENIYYKCPECKRVFKFNIMTSKLEEVENPSIKSMGDNN